MWCCIFAGVLLVCVVFIGLLVCDCVVYGLVYFGLCCLVVASIACFTYLMLLATSLWVVLFYVLRLLIVVSCLRCCLIGLVCFACYLVFFV